MPTRQQLESALINADKAGDAKAAKQLANALKNFTEDTPINQAKVDADLAGLEDEADAVAPSEVGAADVAKGLYETARGAAQGVAFGVPSYMAGAVEGLYKRFTQEGFSPDDAAQLANERAAQFITPPESETGKAIAGFAEKTLGSLPPVMGGVVGQSPSLAQGMRGASMVAKPVMQEMAGGASELAGAIKTGATDLAGRIRADQPSPKGSVGAAAMDEAQRRQMAANQLPVPIQLTKGQATQDMLQQKFERETAKQELGKDLRERYNLQNEQFNANLDAMIDSTETQFGDFSKAETGGVVTKALENQVRYEKKRIKDAYKAADESEEAKEIASLAPVADYLNENMASAGTDSIMLKVQKELKRQGLSEGDLNDGNLQVKDMTVKQAEALRKFINKNTSNIDAAEQRVSSELKSIIDSSVADVGGEPYKRARRLRTRYGEKYQNKKMVADLIGFKPGTTDRRIALEDVSNKVVNLGSAADLKNLRRTLQASDEGKIAFNELAAQALKDIRDKSTSGVGNDERGNPLVSPAKLSKTISELDADGKLDILFGRAGADQLRTLSAVSKDALVSQPGAVNYSNTASSIFAGAIDLMTTATTGIPMPAAMALKKATETARKRKVTKRVKESLDFDATNGNK